MKRYLALLRGVNISGKNQIAMPELKTAAAALGFDDVRTHLNSGNLLFTAPEAAPLQRGNQMRAMIRSRFGLDIPVLVLSQDELREILANAPEWWGTADRNIYDNLIFVLPDSSPEKIAEQIGAPSEGLEQIMIFRRCIFWSFDRAKYAKANWWKKTASNGIAELLTIRTANTLRKIAGM